MSQTYELPRYAPTLELDFKTIDLEKAATQAAEGLRPPTDAVELTVEEKAVVDHYNGEYGKLNHTTTAHFQNLMTEFDGLERLPTNEDFDAALTRSDNDVQTYFHMNKQSLKTIQARAHEALAKYNYFRYDRGIKRDPRVPEPMRLVFAILLAILLAESILNGMFFAKAADFGYLEGVSIAIFVSLVNVGIGFAVGKYFYPLTNEPKRRSRWIGGSVVVAYVLFLVGFNLATAHYRDLAETNPDRAVQLFLSNTIRDPLGLGFYSFVMFFVGLLAGGFSFIKGLHSDDEIPGYLTLYLKMTSTRDAYDAAREEASRQIVRAVEKGQTECAGLDERAKLQVEGMETIASSIKPVREGYQRVRSEIEDACKRHLTLYRDRNRGIRPPRTAPAYFDRFPSYPSAVSFDESSDLSRRVTEAKSRLVLLRKHATGIAERQAGRIKLAHNALDVYLAEVSQEVAKEVRERVNYLTEDPAKPVPQQT